MANAEEKLKNLETFVTDKFAEVEQKQVELSENTQKILELLQKTPAGEEEADKIRKEKEEQVRKQGQGQGQGDDDSGRNNDTLDVYRDNPSASAALHPVPQGQDIQQEYLSLADTVNRVKLVPELRLNDRGTVKTSLRSHLNTVKRCGKYAETTLKLLSTLEAGNVTERDLSELHLCAHAQILYLQDEVANLLAESRYGTDTAGVFRDLQTNTSVFTPERVATLKSALELQTAHSRHQQENSGRGRGRGGGGHNFQNSGYNRRGYWNGGYGNNRGRGGRDVFNNLTSRNIPSDKAHDKQDDSAY